MSKLRSRSFYAVILMLAVLVGSSTVALAQAPVTDDTYVTQTSAASNFGSQGTLAVQAGAQPTYSYVRFNLSQVPAGATVTKATLRLFVTAVTTPGTFDVYLANGPWSESTLTFNNQPGSGAGRAGVGWSQHQPGRWLRDCRHYFPGAGVACHPRFQLRNRTGSVIRLFDLGGV